MVPSARTASSRTRGDGSFTIWDKISRRADCGVAAAARSMAAIEIRKATRVAPAFGCVEITMGFFRCLFERGGIRLQSVHFQGERSYFSGEQLVLHFEFREPALVSKIVSQPCPMGIFATALFQVLQQFLFGD